MAWYNPLSWFGSKGKKAELEIYCDNPQCKRVINREPIAYDKERREIYHDDRCAMFAIAHHAFNSERIVTSNIDYIGIGRAINLFRNDKLSQSKRLEQRVGTLN